MFKPVDAESTEEYIDSIPEPRKSEIIKLDQFIQKIAPTLKPHFAYNMIGYGSFHYKTKSGREGDWPVISLASQKNYISIYICSIVDGKYLVETYDKKLGNVSVGKSCIRLKKLSDLDLDMLKEVIEKGKNKPGL
jgi:hypothetical protein